MSYASALPASWVDAGTEVVAAVGQHGRRRFLAAELRSYGHRVREAHTGLEVVRHLRRCEAQRGPGESLPLVFADMDLPLPNGLLLLSVLRFEGLLGPFVLIVDEARFREFEDTVSVFGALSVEERSVDLDGLANTMNLARQRARALQATRSLRLPERRRHRRLPMELWIEKRARLPPTMASSVTYHRSANLSQGGVSLRQGIPDAAGARVDLNFRLPGVSSRVVVKGKIVDVRPSGREFLIGMQFLDLPAAAQHSIAQFVEDRALLA